MRKVAVVFMTLIAAASTAARTITVDDDNPADFTTIQAAIDDANNGDTVEIQPGTYTGDGNRNIDFLGKAIIVCSTDPNNPNIVASTIIDWQDADRAFLLEECNSIVLAGMTITNGNAYSGAGAIKCIESTVSMNHCVFSNNGTTISSGESGGGAVRSIGSQIVITECAFADNRAEHDGGAVNATSSTMTLSKCTFRQNGSARHGGAVQSSESQITITDCTFAENWSDMSGGAINSNGSLMLNGCSVTGNTTRFYGGGICVHGDATITNCRILDNHCTNDDTRYAYGGGVYAYNPNTFVEVCNSIISGNTAGYGGGMYRLRGALRLLNCIISDNLAAIHGGGIQIYEASSTVTSCTFADNNGASMGGGLMVSEYSNLLVSNCIFWGNVADEGRNILLGGQLYSNGPSELTMSYSDIEGGQAGVSNHSSPPSTLHWSDGNIDADPCFADRGYWDPNGTPEDANDDYWVMGDYHLKSQAGRYDPNGERWTTDEATSPCIDAGDPMSPIGLEPFPNGGIINMGAYGRTAEASKSYFGEPPCETIVAGDINGDCKINFEDFRLMALHWCEDNTP